MGSVVLIKVKVHRLKDMELSVDALDMCEEKELAFYLDSRKNTMKHKLFVPGDTCLENVIRCHCLKSSSSPSPSIAGVRERHCVSRGRDAPVNGGDRSAQLRFRCNQFHTRLTWEQQRPDAFLMDLSSPQAATPPLYQGGTISSNNVFTCMAIYSTRLPSFLPSFTASF